MSATIVAAFVLIPVISIRYTGFSTRQAAELARVVVAASVCGVGHPNASSDGGNAHGDQQ
jgi:hypothetical protein